MQGGPDSAINKMKLALVSMAALGLLFSSPCTVGDAGLNVINGTLSFIKSYTGDVWTELVPPAEELFGQAEEEDDD